MRVPDGRERKKRINHRDTEGTENTEKLRALCVSVVNSLLVFLSLTSYRSRRGENRRVVLVGSSG